ncbi:hypothetical protein D0Z07_8859 [Hyphodiscus hymeniophilus]|uniref:DUF1754-domain-containing protein n=1 Tax=Hyphodiscus hymeniophilus TaxID=353542 RepID=A0A9P6SKU3_9HELO|nr:hypothetical protein D0Z07_8859 [Hyphodiscus hymeniophilus]
MPSDDYAAIRGGLKLKGSKPSGVTKKKKKSKTAKDSIPTTSSNDAVSKDAEGGESALQKALQDEDEDLATRGRGDVGLSEEKLRELDPRDDDGKTASERQYEETRRKRLQDRLAREGVKTHKQRVEELNKYLSTLSEHHDMPRIGPG